MGKETDTVKRKTSKPDPHGFEEVMAAEISSVNKRRGRLFGENSKVRPQLKERFFDPLASSEKKTNDISIRSANDDERDLAMMDLSGIAISGGGVRSAAFSIGALQAMDALGGKTPKPETHFSAFEKMDYMSTVSGGGYTGSCISASMRNSAKFPFPSILKKTEPDVLRHVRDHSNYLFPRGGFIEKTLNLASYLRGIFANLPAVALMFFLAVLITVLLKGPWPWESSLVDLKISNMVDILSIILKKLFNFSGFGETRGFFQASILASLMFMIGMVFWAGKRSWFKAKKADYVTPGTWFWRFCILLLVGIFFVELQPKLIFGIQEQYCASVVDRDEPRVSGTLTGYGIDPVMKTTVEANRRNLYDLANCEETGVKWEHLPYSERKEIARLQKLEMPLPSSTGLWSFILGQLQGLTGSLTILAGAFAAFKGITGIGDSNTSKQQSGFSGLIKKYSSTVVTLLIGLLLPLVLWLAYLYLSFWSLPGQFDGYFWYAHQPGWLRNMGIEIYLVYTFIALISFLAVWYINANENSPHNLYRDRLAEAFLVAPDENRPQSGGEIVVKSEADMLLSDINNRNAPFHLINAAVNIQNSPHLNGRGRNAGFFTFSQSHVGSFETGYVETKKVEKVEKSFKLATAMAISAAAASTAMGGLTRKPLAFTLALLNVRLGYWFPNPRKLCELNPTSLEPGESKNKQQKEQAVIEQKNAHYFFSESIKGRSTSAIALYKEITNKLTETGNRVYLTDGGHIENLGLYSLLKRRCKFIIVIDGEADPELNFSSFKTAQRFARIDLGTRIDLPTDQIVKSNQAAREQIHGKTVGKRVAEFSRKTGDEKNKGADTLPIEKRVQCAIGTIKYPADDKGDPQEGYLLYVKSSLCGAENDYVLEYARKNPAFPHETTGDQFFSEEQFEAYRALGFHIMHHALSGADKIQSGKEKLNLNGVHPSLEDKRAKQWNLFMGELESRYPV